MMSWGKAERKAGRFLKQLDADDLYDQLDNMAAYLKELTSASGKMANRQWGRARDLAADTAHDAEEAIQDNLAVSLILALGLGVVIGYLIRRSSA